MPHCKCRAVFPPLASAPLAGADCTADVHEGLHRSVLLMAICRSARHFLHVQQRSVEHSVAVQHIVNGANDVLVALEGRLVGRCGKRWRPEFVVSICACMAAVPFTCHHYQLLQFYEATKANFIQKQNSPHTYMRAYRALCAPRRGGDQEPQEPPALDPRVAAFSPHIVRFAAPVHYRCAQGAPQGAKLKVRPNNLIICLAGHLCRCGTRKLLWSSCMQDSETTIQLLAIMLCVRLSHVQLLLVRQFSSTVIHC